MKRLVISKEYANATGLVKGIHRVTVYPFNTGFLSIEVDDETFCFFKLRNKLEEMSRIVFPGTPQLKTYYVREDNVQNNH